MQLGCSSSRSTGTRLLSGMGSSRGLSSGSIRRFTGVAALSSARSGTRNGVVFEVLTPWSDPGIRRARDCGLQRFPDRCRVFRSPTFASAARQARSRCLAASGEREGAGTRDTDLENGLDICVVSSPFSLSLLTRAFAQLHIRVVRIYARS